MKLETCLVCQGKGEVNSHHSAALPPNDGKIVASKYTSVCAICHGTGTHILEVDA